MRRSSRTRGDLLAFLALLLASCGAEPAPQAPTLRRLALAEGGTALERGVITLERLDAPALAERLLAPGGRTELVKSGAGDTLQLIEGQSLVLRGPFPDPGADRLLLNIQVPQGGQLTVIGEAGGKLLGRSSAELPSRGGWQVLELPMRWAFYAPQPAERILLRFTRLRRPPQLRSIELNRGPPLAWLPPPRNPGLVELGTDSRRAVGISSREPLETRAMVHPGERLVFSLGMPRELNSLRRETHLRVRVLDGEREVTSRDLPCPVESWSQHAVPIELERPRELTLRFELDDGGEEEVVAALGSPFLEPARADPPTVVLITSDTHRADHVGAARSGVEIETPFLDSLAERGAFFEDCNSPTNVTTPSHISVMTALPLRDHRVHGNDMPLGEGPRTLAEAFAEAGWLTYAATSVVHLSPQWSGLDRGFDRYSSPGEIERDAADTIADLERWLDEPRDAPLFIWLHLFDAHSPYEAREPFTSVYWGEREDPFDATRTREGWRAPNWAPEITSLEYIGALYRGEITYLDSRLAALFEHPRLAGALTAVVADHGEHLVSHFGSFGHYGLAPATLDVPLVLAGPGVPRGVRIARPVQQPDLGRTLLDLAGLPLSAFPGENLLDERSTAPTRFAIASNAKGASVRRDRWMLVQSFFRVGTGGGRLTDHSVQLYDTVADPGLEEDLAGDRYALTLELRTALLRWLEAARPLEGPAPVRRDDEETRAKLAQLGYTSGPDEPARSSWFDLDCDCQWCERFPVEIQ